MTTHAGAAESPADPRVRKDRRHGRAFNAGEVPADRPRIPWTAAEDRPASDGEQRTRLRGPVSQGFAPSRVDRMRGRAVAVTGSLPDGVEALPVRPR
ncbi:hypothetical protein ACIRPH_20840 [Nocardiopsis sp. NPDC101807]|uniref:hypothetical protein n=1 Tax=Nocardiopsis sp. NPDC101807 TaxID=3364339 RepID=UPI00380C7664